MSLTDPHGRTIDYMRVSITERCNLNCIYCRPAASPPVDASPGGGIPLAGGASRNCAASSLDGSPRERECLTYEEILAVCRQAALLGIRHIRLTGGEPLVRKDCCDLAFALKNVPGIETVTLTTNGVLLSRCAGELKSAGIDGINVSLDTLDRERYRSLTGSDCLNEVVGGIREAVALKIPVKLNCVTMEPSKIPPGGDCSGDLFRLAELARALPLDVRFIEAMPIGESWCPALDHRKLLKLFSLRYPGMERTEAARGFGPAVYYRIPGFSGCIGFISAIHGNFCQSCNRIRLTSEGVLKSCLGYEGTIRLKPLFLEPEPESALRAALLEAVKQKPPFHRFGDPKFHTGRETMSKIGG